MILTRKVRDCLNLADGDIEDVNADRADGNDEATEEEDADDTELLAGRELETPHHWDGQSEDENVGQEISDGARLVKSHDIDAVARRCLGEGAEPNSVDRVALEQGGEEVAHSPSDDNGAPDGVEDPEGRVGEDATV